MENFLEALMVISFCFAVGIMLYRFATNKCVHRRLDRLTVITIGMGFAFGVAEKVLVKSATWVSSLYVVGIWLCYTAVLFSLPDKGGCNHE